MRSSSAPPERPRRLRRWLRYSWLSRLPLVGSLLRPRRPQPPPRPTCNKALLDLVQLEVRSVPNDPFGMAQAALAVPALAEMAVAMQTPAQVLLHGFSGTSLYAALDPTNSTSQTATLSSPCGVTPNGQLDRNEADTVRTDHADAFFLGLQVTPRDEEGRAQPTDQPTGPAQRE